MENSASFANLPPTSPMLRQSIDSVDPVKMRESLASSMSVSPIKSAVSFTRNKTPQSSFKDEKPALSPLAPRSNTRNSISSWKEDGADCPHVDVKALAQRFNNQTKKRISDSTQQVPRSASAEFVKSASFSITRHIPTPNPASAETHQKPPVEAPLPEKHDVQEVTPTEDPVEIVLMDECLIDERLIDDEPAHDEAPNDLQMINEIGTQTETEFVLIERSEYESLMAQTRLPKKIKLFQ
jgi:hypothetical protein